MLLPILLIFLSFVIPIVLLRSFSTTQRFFVASVILLHIAVMLILHNGLVTTQGLPIVIDGNVDAQKYYYWTERFVAYPPFTLTREDIKGLTGATNYGYMYLIGTFWTITNSPILAARLFKTMMFFIGMSCLTRVWRVDYGERLAIHGFAFMSLVVTAAFYYNYRNLKDSLVMTMFIFVMAGLVTLFRPRHDQLQPLTFTQTAFFWLTTGVSLYLLAALRLYTAVIVVVSVVMHFIMGSRMSLRARISLVAGLGLLGLFALRGNLITETVEMGKGRELGGVLSPYVLFHALVSPIPWQNYEKWLTPFHWVYLFLLPYTLYTFFRHFLRNFNWQLFVVMMVYYVNGLTQSGARKRITAFPIMVGWVLAHLAYKKQLFHQQQADEAMLHEDWNDYCSEYSQEYAQVGQDDNLY